MDFTTAVKILGIAIILIGMVLALALTRASYKSRIYRRKTDQAMQGRPIPELSAWHSPLYKRLAPLALLVFPLAAVTVGNYHIFEGTQDVGSCLRCHVMTPIANDMMDQNSTTLAARHFKNRWIANKQCFTCHKDYGLNGTIKAKMDGFRHLVKYSLRTYEEPIRYVGRFNNDNCLQCHRDTPKWEAIESHQTVLTRLEENRTNCTHCHGFPHPTSLERTPGTDRYQELMSRYNGGGAE